MKTREKSRGNGKFPVEISQVLDRFLHRFDKASCMGLSFLL